MKYLGKQGIDSLVLGLHERAVQFAKELKKKGFHILNDVVFNQILVSCENDDATTKTIEVIQNSPECWCGGAQWGNRKVIRVSICSWATTSEDIEKLVAPFEKAYNTYRKSNNKR